MLLNPCNGGKKLLLDGSVSSKGDFRHRPGGREMNEITNNNRLSVEFVQRDYFIDRIFVLEQKYQRQWNGWDNFLEAYRVKDASVDSSNFELDEWAFLCEEFESDLLLRDFRHEKPPRCCESGSQKPERTSGFRIWGLLCLTPQNISSTCNVPSNRARATRQ